ncbi:MAG: hypothetical protein HGA55_06215, partial [Methanoregulaceae archaeon]|nr:hypothetical protein [Methanoregulaceae archaeon]
PGRLGPSSGGEHGDGPGRSGRCVRGHLPGQGGGDGTGTGMTGVPVKATELQILDELKAIRVLLERKL